MSIEKEMVRIACKALDDKKAKDIKIIDIHEVSVIADYFVIASLPTRIRYRQWLTTQMRCLAVPDMRQNRSREPETPAGFLWIMAI